MRAQLPQNCAGYGIVIAGEMAVDEVGEEQRAWVQSCSKVVSPSVACLVRYLGSTEGSLPLLKPDFAPKDTLAP